MIWRHFDLATRLSWNVSFSIEFCISLAFCLMRTELINHILTYPYSGLFSLTISKNDIAFSVVAKTKNREIGPQRKIAAVEFFFEIISS